MSVSRRSLCSTLSQTSTQRLITSKSYNEQIPSRGNESKEFVTSSSMTIYQPFNLNTQMGQSVLLSEVQMKKTPHSYLELDVETPIRNIVVKYWKDAQLSSDDQMTYKTTDRIAAIEFYDSNSDVIAELKSDKFSIHE